MRGYNVIAVYNCDKTRLLMCKRSKNPYIGLSNLAGGKTEPGEAGEGNIGHILEHVKIHAEELLFVP